MIPARLTYLLVELGCIAVPFIFSFHPRIRFHKQWSRFLPACLLAAAAFTGWDIFFTHIGIWRFNPKYVIGTSLWGLPLEEYLFFIIIPYCSIFTYHSISSFYNFDRFLKVGNIISVCLIMALAIMGFYHLARLYTSVTFLSLAATLLLLLFMKVRFLPAFYVTFIVILLPFFLSNGVLTGSFIAEPVVIYNSDHNLGWRMFTIPFEDTFYGMLLILLNVAGFEHLNSRQTVSEE